MRTGPGSRLAAGLSAGVLTLVLGGCGSDVDDSGADALTGLGVSTGTATVGSEVTAQEGDSTLTLSEGSLTVGTHTFVVRNTGSATHALAIVGPGGVDATSAPVRAGGTTTLTVSLQAGQYQVYCPIGDDRARGVGTTLRVG